MYEVEESDYSMSMQGRNSSQAPRNKYSSKFNQRNLSLQPKAHASGSVFSPNSKRKPSPLPIKKKESNAPLNLIQQFSYPAPASRGKSNSVMVMQGLGMKTTKSDPLAKLNEDEVPLVQSVRED